MKIWLLRHGEASTSAQTDEQRPLTEQGKQQVLRSAEQLPKSLKQLVVSPYLRAQQSAELVRNQVSFEKEKTSQLVVPMADVATLISWLEESDADDLLIVAHNPLLSRLAQVLTADPHINLHTGDLVGLQADLWVAGMANPM